MNVPPLRPRSVGEILDLGFQLYRGRWLQLALATGMLLLPLLVMLAVVPADALPLLDLASEPFHVAASAAVVVIASEAYLGRQATAVQAVRAVGRRFLSVGGAAIIQYLLIGIGFLLLLVPGFVAIAWTFAIQQAVMIEGRPAFDAFERSRELAAGHWKPILLTSAVMIVIVIFAMLGFVVVLAERMADPRLSLLLVNVGMTIINPLCAVIGTVLYYDLRIRKEAFDVSVAADRLPGAPPSPVPAY